MGDESDDASGELVLSKAARATAGRTDPSQCGGGVIPIKAKLSRNPVKSLNMLVRFLTDDRVDLQGIKDGG